MGSSDKVGKRRRKKRRNRGLGYEAGKAVIDLLKTGNRSANTVLRGVNAGIGIVETGVRGANQALDVGDMLLGKQTGNTSKAESNDSVELNFYLSESRRMQDEQEHEEEDYEDEVNDDDDNEEDKDDGYEEEEEEEEEEDDED